MALRKTPQILFQSTSPVWGMTNNPFTPVYYRGISIHIPRVGDDDVLATFKLEIGDFNPHPPCGG